MISFGRHWQKNTARKRSLYVRTPLLLRHRKMLNTLPTDQPPNIRFPEHPAQLPPVKKARPLNQFNAKPPPAVKETLMELQLVPQSLLLVRFDEDELNRTSLGPIPGVYDVLTVGGRLHRFG